jgi:hypothetical protein
MKLEAYLGKDVPGIRDLMTTWQGWSGIILSSKFDPFYTYPA